MSKRSRISFEDQEEEEINLPSFKKKVLDWNLTIFSDDVIFEIISFMIQDEFIICSCSLISKQWQIVILKYSKLSISIYKTREHFHVIETSQFLPNIVQITINTFYCAENILKPLLNMPNLKTLILNTISEEQALDIKKMPQLTSISIDGSTSKECLKSITRSKQLTALKFTYLMDFNYCTRKKFKYISRMKQLKHLEIPSWGVYTLMERFKKTDQLTYLNVSSNYLYLIGFKEITKFKQLKYLNVSKNRIFERSDIKPTCLLTQLTILDISHNEVKLILVEYIKELKLLTDLNISFNLIKSEGAKVLSEMNQLTKLDIESNEIGFEGAKHICEMKQLSNLNIRKNNIGDEGIKLISGMNQLTHLDIDN